MTRSKAWRAALAIFRRTAEAFGSRPPAPAPGSARPTGDPGPGDLAARHVRARPEDIRTLKGVLVELFFSRHPEGYLDTCRGQSDLNDHLTARLESDRRVLIPWINGVRPLSGASVLEVGCGTGSSTIALSEQGAFVTALDVEPRSLEVARARAGLYGQTVEFRIGNGADLADLFPSKDFDIVLFFASLEHMFLQERLRAIGGAWELVSAGGLLGVIETPNRLWFHDHHTSLLPFFNWLPNDLAFLYSRFSPRENFREVYRDPSADAMAHFLRRGRGVSFHEFDLALRPVETLDVASALSQRPLAEESPEDRFFRLLKAAGRPGIHDGFYEPSLNILIRKT